GDLDLIYVDSGDWSWYERGTEIEVSQAAQSPPNGFETDWLFTTVFNVWQLYAFVWTRPLPLGFSFQPYPQEWIDQLANPNVA
ncbi:MAG: hypothetical protein AAF483_08785, partial [Planctomycetota bacterium]